MDITKYIDENIKLIPSSEIVMRDYVDNVKSISSDYKLAIPGSKTGKEIIEKTIEVGAFKISRFLVTNELYDFVYGRNCDLSDKEKPVTDVSWYNAIDFCNLLSDKIGLKKYYAIDGKSVERNLSSKGFRLPTDEEWQLAAQAGVQKYRYGNIDDICWYENNSEGSKQDVAQKAENSFGLFDMLGNVWEWCWDIYDVERYGDYRVFRGGSWASDERSCGSTVRRKSMPDLRIDDLGFRIAQNV